MSFDEKDWPLSYWEGAFRAFESEMGGRQPARIAQCWDLLQRAERLETEVERLRNAAVHWKREAKREFWIADDDPLADARAQEREACAQRLEERAHGVTGEAPGCPPVENGSFDHGRYMALREGARLIRGRGEGGE